MRFGAQLGLKANQDGVTQKERVGTEPGEIRTVNTVEGVQVGCFPDLYNALTGNPPDQVITL